MKKPQSHAAIQHAAVLLAMALGLSLSGCSNSPSGPPHDVVKLNYVRWMFFNPDNYNLTRAEEKRELPKFYEQTKNYLRVQSCQRSQPGTWSCFVYMKGVGTAKGKVIHRDIIVLNHEGSHWTLNRSLSHEASQG
jgi:hypothetical protein